MMDQALYLGKRPKCERRLIATRPIRLPGGCLLYRLQFAFCEPTSPPPTTGQSSKTFGSFLIPEHRGDRRD